MLKRLRSRRGETLVETLAAILIVTLSSVVLLSMTVAAVRIDRMAAESDQDFRAELTAVEEQEKGGDGSVMLDKYRYEVDLYKGEGGLTAYGLKGAGA